MIIIDKFPTAAEFYQTYWGKKPFAVKGAVAPEVFDDLIDGNSLAALSLEDEVKSRLVMTATEGGKWDCEHGPFEETRFDDIGDKNWSLLVQNVEQYHTPTANLLKHFNFAPRWLMDDIMVSFSAAGGSVGPHTDSYHVFLVQGQGRRSWTIGDTPIIKEDCIEGLDLKVLKDGVKGTTVEVEIGDIIYIPPHYAHEGMTLDPALTFSVGFLGPRMSELFIEYGQYLEQFENEDIRYSGQGLNENDARFDLSKNTQETIKNQLTGALNEDHFSIWLSEYFSTNIMEDEIEEREEALDTSAFLARLKNNETLYKPEHIKIVITELSDSTLCLSVFGHVLPTTEDHRDLLMHLKQHDVISIQDLENWAEHDAILYIIEIIYNQKALFFESEDIDL